MSQLFPSLSLGSITALLTVITLFFGELLPKALAVANSELVTRKLVPSISRLASILSPLIRTFTATLNMLLSLFGMRNQEDTNVSADMLRMIITEAERTAGIDTSEGKVIKNVLDMDTREVEKIMQPRVEIVA